MNTKLLLSLSAIAMGLTGLLLEFFPHETLDYLGVSSAGPAPLLMQLTGALYLGFAMTNWMAKGITIGGIYARPLAIGNFMHFVVAALATIKSAATGQTPVVWVIAVVYSIFAVLFGIVAFTHPKQAKAAAG